MRHGVRPDGGPVMKGPFSTPGATKGPFITAGATKGSFITGGRSEVS